MKKLFAFIFFVIALIQGCLQPEIIEPDFETVSNQEYNTYTTLSEQKHLIPVLKKINEQTRLNKTSSFSRHIADSINVERIMKIMQNDSSHFAYSLELKSKLNPEFDFGNLIIKETDKGYLGFVLLYKKAESDEMGFSGEVARYDLYGNLLRVYELENSSGQALNKGQKNSSIQCNEAVTIVEEDQECTCEGEPPSMTTSLDQDWIAANCTCEPPTTTIIIDLCPPKGSETTDDSEYGTIIDYPAGGGTVPFNNSSNTDNTNTNSNNEESNSDASIDGLEIIGILDPNEARTYTREELRDNPIFEPLTTDRLRQLVSERFVGMEYQRNIIAGNALELAFAEFIKDDRNYELYYTMVRTKRVRPDFTITQIELPDWHIYKPGKFVEVKCTEKVIDLNFSNKQILGEIEALSRYKESLLRRYLGSGFGGEAKDGLLQFYLVVTEETIIEEELIKEATDRGIGFYISYSYLNKETGGVVFSLPKKKNFLELPDVGLQNFRGATTGGVQINWDKAITKWKDSNEYYEQN